MPKGQILFGQTSFSIASVLLFGLSSSTGPFRFQSKVVTSGVLYGIKRLDLFKSIEANFIVFKMVTSLIEEEFEKLRVHKESLNMLEDEKK